MLPYVRSSTVFMVNWSRDVRTIIKTLSQGRITFYIFHSKERTFCCFMDDCSAIHFYGLFSRNCKSALRTVHRERLNGLRSDDDTLIAKYFRTYRDPCAEYSRANRTRSFTWLIMESAISLIATNKLRAPVTDRN